MAQGSTTKVGDDIHSKRDGQIFLFDFNKELIKMLSERGSRLVNIDFLRTLICIVVFRFQCTRKQGSLGLTDSFGAKGGIYMHQVKSIFYVYQCSKIQAYHF